jgi:pyruvate dehydrogenase E1 component alpha subunit
MAADISNNTLKKLYRMMLRIRLSEESLVEPIMSGEVKCPVHLYSGEEAVATGLCSALKKEDYIFGTHRSHGHYLAKGGGIREMMAEIFCRETGCSKGRGGSMHLVDPENGILGTAPIVAGTISLALGAALASSIRNDKRVTVSFFGDGATGEGVLYESINFAALKKLPLIFACENNLYSTHMPLDECRPRNNIYETGKAFCIKSIRVDGNDVIKVFNAAQNAVKACRKREGPVFIEFMTYRMRGHVGPDDNIQGKHTDIRPAEEVEKWRKKDPINKLKRFLYQNKIMNEDQFDRIQKQVEKEVTEAIKFARQSPHPKKRELRKHVFKEEND